MSLIVCAENCRHQSDGYCQLNHITSLSGNTGANCGYYEKTDKEKNASRASAEKAESVR